MSGQIPSSRNRVWMLMWLISVGMAACARPVTDPTATLADASDHTIRHARSIEMLRTSPDRTSTEATDALQGLIYRPGYVDEIRLSGLELLLEDNPDRLVRTTRQRLARTSDPMWLDTYCRWLGDQDWSDPVQRETINEALISSWGVWWPKWLDEERRPEYLALVKLNGRERVIPLVFETFNRSTKASQRGLRSRCWELLHRLGQREALIELVKTTPTTDANAMMIDLRAAATDFGMVPHNREEILWLRKIRQPERAEFWEDASRSMAAVPADRRRDLEIRDLAIIVGIQRHRPEWITATDEGLYRSVDEATREQKHYYETEPGMPSDGARRERLFSHRDRLTWGDLLAMNLALEALAQTPLRRHLFDYADRDHVDEGTEYGGIIQLDDQGRFELVEFLPRVRHHDRRFNASQQMFDAGYTGLFHMHFHAQRHRNGDHAGPGLGDLNYADNTRTNNLVFTFVDEDTMNVDFYRHGQVIVDLGTIARPGAGGSGG